MKTKFLTSFCFFFFGLSLFAQTWTVMNAATTNDIWGVSFVNSTTGWISCSAGEIRKTTDGGASWTAQTTGLTTPILRDIRMFDQNTGWSVGDNGTILHTTDGGTNWTAQTSGVTATLRHISFVSTSNVWVSGANGTILHSTDGGANWTAQTTGTTVGLMSLRFVDAMNGWAVGSSGGVVMGAILHTIDGGATWTSQTYPTNNNLNACSFVDAMNGWVAGPSGSIYHTSDGGANWTTQTSPVTNIYRAVDFTDATHGWLVDDLGDIVATTDGGANWTSQSSVNTHFFRTVSMLNSNTGFAAGNAGLFMVYSYNPPVMALNNSITSFTTNLGTPSASQSFDVNGTNLTGNIQVDAPTEFEVSLSASSGFGASVQLVPVAGTVASTPVYVRYNPAAAGVHNGMVIVSSPGVSAQSFQVDGASTATAVTEINVSEWNIYPNPVFDAFVIRMDVLSGNEKFAIYSTDGKMVFDGKLNQLETEISVAGLENGNYVLRLSSEEKNSSKKLSVIH